MKIARSPQLLQKLVRGLKLKGRTVGLVPTMGALHHGHLSLINKSLGQNDATIVSIFVNPSQFGPGEDYLRYPRPFARDKELCRAAGVDILFAPTIKAMYPRGYLTFIQVENMSDILCGSFRPGHFRGVATVVAKLFNIASPDRAYFGQKDYQQLRVIERMVKDLNFLVKIVPCPIVREPSGLAVSSRNAYLSREEKTSSSAISKALQQASYLIKYRGLKNTGKIINKLKELIRSGIPGARIDYIDIRDIDNLEKLSSVEGPAAILCAVWVGKTRLIDNIILKS